MPTNYTTADDYLPGGWYPGKRHSLGQNIARVASMGIYNPDNRDESRYNKQIIANKVQNAAARERATDIMAMEEQRRAAAEARLMENLKRMYPDMAPDAMSKLVGSALGGQKVVTDVAEGRAAEQDAIRRERRAVGGQVGASQSGEALTAAEEAMANAEKERAREQEAQASANRRAGVPEATANSTAASQDYNRYKTLFDRDKLSRESDIFQSTADVDMATGRTAAENRFAEENLRNAQLGNETRVAEGTGAALQEPGMSYEIGKARMTAPLSKQVAPGGTLVIPGQPNVLGQQTGVMVVDTAFDEDGNVVRRTPVKSVGAPGSVTTAEPAPAPAPKSPGASFIKGPNGWTPKGR